MASYDLLIIGAGPAAWSCAMTARQRGLTTAVACAQSATSWLQRAERIDNYPGLPQISGKELLSRFRAQAADMGVVIIEQLARQIMPSGDIYMTLVGRRRRSASGAIRRRRSRSCWRCRTCGRRSGAIWRIRTAKQPCPPS